AELRGRRQVRHLRQDGGGRARDDARRRVPRRARRYGAQEVVRVVISGASSGIGEALARHYAAPGNTLGLISRRAVQVDGKSVSYPVDVTDTAAIVAAAKDFIGRFGAPDLVIANAGISIG